MRLPQICKTFQLLPWAPFWIYQILSDALAASLGFYKDNVCNSRISKISILHAIVHPWSLPAPGKFSYIFCDKLPFFRPFCLNSHFIFNFLLWAKCLPLDLNVIAYNLWKNGFETFFRITQCFTYNWPPSWTPSWIYWNAQWCQSGIARMFQGHYTHYQNL